MKESPGEQKLSGNVIASELARNMELGQFEMAYAVLLPCFYTVYLHPVDYARLKGVLELVSEDARKALRSRVRDLNTSPSGLGLKKRSGAKKEYKIACGEWDIEFLPDPEVAPGDVEIHSELSETAQPGFRGTKTTLIGKEPTVTQRLTRGRQRQEGTVYAALHYQSAVGPQTYLITSNQIRIGRGGEEQEVDLALTESDEISREHLVIRRDPATGVFTIVDASTNGTWVNGKRLRKGAEDLLPGRAQIGVGEVLTLAFEARA